MLPPTAPHTAVSASRGSDLVSDPTPVIDDLREESEELDRLVAGLEPERWASPTPAAGWTVAHQIGHLAWTDHCAWTAVTDPDGFRALVEQALAAPHVRRRRRRGVRPRPARRAARPLAGGARGAGEGVAGGAGRGAVPLVRAADVRRLRGHRPSDGDLGARPGRRRHARRHPRAHRPAEAHRLAWRPHPRLRPRRARAHSAGRPLPRRAHRARRGGLGVRPRGRPQRVTGSALDFCLLVTQRAHRADLDLTADGPDADRWLDIAQAFAGPPGEGREPKGGAQ